MVFILLAGAAGKQIMKTAVVAENGRVPLGALPCRDMSLKLCSKRVKGLDIGR